MPDDITLPSAGSEPEPGYAVTSTTDVVPSAADAGRPARNLLINRPPVSTNLPNVPIAHSLTAGAGAGGQGQAPVLP